MQCEPITPTIDSPALCIGSCTTANRSEARGGSLQPGIELVPCPTVDPDLSARAALSTPDTHSTAAGEVAPFERECFADPQSGTPQQHNQGSESPPVGAVTDRAHHSDDLLDRRRIGRVLLALVSGRTPVIPRHRRRRATAAIRIEPLLAHRGTACCATGALGARAQQGSRRRDPRLTVLDRVGLPVCVRGSKREPDFS
jgi:hypothetical protein